jgi:hypothetical protein
MAKDANATSVVGLLIEVANTDTVYRDLYLRRARQLLGAALDESAYGYRVNRQRDRRGLRWARIKPESIDPIMNSLRAADYASIRGHWSYHS